MVSTSGTVKFAGVEKGNCPIKGTPPLEKFLETSRNRTAEVYVPTEKAEKNGHYSAFISSGQTGYEGGEQLVRETLQNIREMLGK